MSNDIDSLVGYLHKNLTKLETYAKDPKHDKSAVITEITRLKHWLIEDPSIQLLKCIQSYTTFLWQNYGTDYKSRMGFVMRLKSLMGFAEIQVKGNDRMFAVKSLSFGACSNKARKQYLEELKAFSLKTWGDDFNAWYDYWIENPELV